MSKSNESSKGVIFLTDTPDEARAKILSATTDSLNTVSYNKEKQPGVTNLLDLLALFTGRPLEDVIQQHERQTQYGPLKSAVADALTAFLTEIQAALSAVDMNAIHAKLSSSEEQMNQQANATLLKVQKAVGLRM
jgi:tryptophanyl-tRNA synthetase